MLCPQTIVRQLHIVALYAIFFSLTANAALAQHDSHAHKGHAHCIHQQLLHETINENPKIKQILDEQEAWLQHLDRNSHALKNDTEIIIPIVVHVLYHTNYQNISTSQINNQIAILNDDFNRRNDIQNNLQSRAADVKFTFELADEDPDGNPTNGIVRKYTYVNEYSVNLSQSLTSTSNRSMKEDALGGSDAWPSDQYLNIWVINMSAGYRGFATFPNSVPNEYDGIVMNYQYFGSIGTGNDFQFFDGGRTLTHEVGHWLNLKHIWGNGCGSDDGVSDTPNQSSYTSGCPGFSSSCGSSDLWQNFMDYTYDDCMQLFTEGQKTRMRAVFEPGGGRSTFQHKLLYGLIGDQVWSDTNMDGIQQSSEPGASNVIVNVYNHAHEMVDSELTDANGNFLFTEIPSGDYYLEFVPPTTESFTDAKIGSPFSDSDVSHANGTNTTDMFALAPGEYRSDIDAGLAVNAVLAADWLELSSQAISDRVEQISFSWLHNEPIKEIHLQAQIANTKFEDVMTYDGSTIPLEGHWSFSMDRPEEDKIYRIRLQTLSGIDEYSNLIHVSGAITAEPDIKIFPNPARLTTTVAVSASLEVQEVSILDGQGRAIKPIIMSADISEGMQQIELDCSELPSGMYHILLENDKSHYSRRLYVTD